MYETRIYQDLVTEHLTSIFGEDNVKKEWDVSKDSQDDYTRRLYCPKIDVAVGPFNISRYIERDNERIRSMATRYMAFLQALFDASEMPIGGVEQLLDNRNKNPRCFLGIEIEKSGSRKHMLGDIANASIIASIGILIPLNNNMLSGFKGIKRYLEFAMKVKKTKRLFDNILIISAENFLKVLSEYVRTM